MNPVMNPAFYQQEKLAEAASVVQRAARIEGWMWFREYLEQQRVYSPLVVPDVLVNFNIIHTLGWNAQEALLMAKCLHLLKNEELLRWLQLKTAQKEKELMEERRMNQMRQQQLQQQLQQHQMQQQRIIQSLMSLPAAAPPQPLPMMSVKPIIVPPTVRPSVITRIDDGQEKKPRRTYKRKANAAAENEALNAEQKPHRTYKKKVQVVGQEASAPVDAPSTSRIAKSELFSAATLSQKGQRKAHTLPQLTGEARAERMPKNSLPSASFAHSSFEELDEETRPMYFEGPIREGGPLDFAEAMSLDARNFQKTKEQVSLSAALIAQPSCCESFSGPTEETVNVDARLQAKRKTMKDEIIIAEPNIETAKATVLEPKDHFASAIVSLTSEPRIPAEVVVTVQSSSKECVEASVTSPKEEIRTEQYCFIRPTSHAGVNVTFMDMHRATAEMSVQETSESSAEATVVFVGKEGEPATATAVLSKRLKKRKSRWTLKKLTKRDMSKKTSGTLLNNESLKVKATFPEPRKRRYKNNRRQLDKPSSSHVPLIDGKAVGPGSVENGKMKKTNRPTGSSTDANTSAGALQETVEQEERPRLLLRIRLSQSSTEETSGSKKGRSRKAKEPLPTKKARTQQEDKPISAAEDTASARKRQRRRKESPEVRDEVDDTAAKLPRQKRGKHLNAREDSNVDDDERSSRKRKCRRTTTGAGLVNSDLRLVPETRNSRRTVHVAVAKPIPATSVSDKVSQPRGKKRPKLSKRSAMTEEENVAVIVNLKKNSCTVDTVETTLVDVKSTSVRKDIRSSEEVQSSVHHGASWKKPDLETDEPASSSSSSVMHVEPKQEEDTTTRTAVTSQLFASGGSTDVKIQQTSTGSIREEIVLQGAHDVNAIVETLSPSLTAQLEGLDRYVEILRSKEVAEDTKSEVNDGQHADKSVSANFTEVAGHEADVQRRLRVWKREKNKAKIQQCPQITVMDLCGKSKTLRAVWSKGACILMVDEAAHGNGHYVCNINQELIKRLPSGWKHMNNPLLSIDANGRAQGYAIVDVPVYKKFHCPGSDASAPMIVSFTHTNDPATFAEEIVNQMRKQAEMLPQTNKE